MRKKKNCPKGLREVFSYGYKLGGYMSKIQLIKAELDGKIQNIINEISKEEARLESGAKALIASQRRKRQTQRAKNSSPDSGKSP